MDEPLFWGLALSTAGLCFGMAFRMGTSLPRATDEERRPNYRMTLWGGLIGFAAFVALKDRPEAGDILAWVVGLSLLALPFGFLAGATFYWLSRTAKSE